MKPISFIFGIHRPNGSGIRWLDFEKMQVGLIVIVWDSEIGPMITDGGKPLNG